MHVLNHDDALKLLKMSAVGLGLEGRLNLGGWRPVGGGSSDLSVCSPDPV